MLIIKPPGRTRKLLIRLGIIKYWTPFDKNGFIDHARLESEGWARAGVMTEDK